MLGKKKKKPRHSVDYRLNYKQVTILFVASRSVKDSCSGFKLEAVLVCSCCTKEVEFRTRRVVGRTHALGRHGPETSVGCVRRCCVAAVLYR